MESPQRHQSQKKERGKKDFFLWRVYTRKEQNMSEFKIHFSLDGVIAIEGKNKEEAINTLQNMDITELIDCISSVIDIKNVDTIF